MLEGEYDSASTDNSGPAHSPDSESSAKYEMRAESIHATVQGDNRGTINNHYTSSPLEWIQFLKEFDLTIISRDDNRAANFSADQMSMRQRIGEALQDAASANEDISYTSSQTSMAVAPIDVAEWYYQLSEYERYYVVAVALLQGAPAADISLQARELYRACVPIDEASPHDIAPATRRGIPSEAAASLRNRTYTIAVQSPEGVRLFWQQADFGIQVLRFIARESIEWSGSRPDQSFCELLQTWPEELSGERSRRAARSLGVILAYQSPNQLWRVANAWANDTRERNWRLVALLLGGAYEAACSDVDQETGHSIKDSVVRLLKQWTERFLQTTNIRVACAAARTYTQLGKRAPEIALQGVEQMLQLPPAKRPATVRLDDCISSLVSAYVSLTWAGHTREVLKVLAIYVEQWSHQHKQSTQEHQRYRQQREMVLSITFDAFFLIAATSLAAESKDGEVTLRYEPNTVCPVAPVLPDPGGRDILLLGFLSQSETSWSLHISTLLCSALLEKKDKAVYDLLSQWVEIISSQPNRMDLLMVFSNLMVDLGQRLDAWCNEFRNRNISREADRKYREKLVVWKRNTQTPLGRLAQQVLLRLSSE